MNRKSEDQTDGEELQNHKIQLLEERKTKAFENDVIRLLNMIYNFLWFLFGFFLTTYLISILK